MSRLADRASGQSVQRRLVREPPRHLLEQTGRKNAVVVGKGDEICPNTSERRVAGARKASWGAQPLDGERMLFTQNLVEAIVLVLIDEQHAKVAVRLRLQRRKQALELGNTVDGCDDEVERGERLTGH